MAGGRGVYLGGGREGRISRGWEGGAPTSGVGGRGAYLGGGREGRLPPDGSGCTTKAPLVSRGEGGCGGLVAAEGGSSAGAVVEVRGRGGSNILLEKEGGKRRDILTITDNNR